MKKSLLFIAMISAKMAAAQSAPINATLADPCAYLSVPAQEKHFDFTLFPNPNSGVFQLIVDKYFLDNQTRLTITDVSGKEVFRMEQLSSEGHNHIPVRLGDASNGVYIVVLRTANFVATRKLIINQ